MNRVFSNLVNNACQYANKININAKKQEDNFILSVDDNGPGTKEIRRKYLNLSSKKINQGT